MCAYTTSTAYKRANLTHYDHKNTERARRESVKRYMRSCGHRLCTTVAIPLDQDSHTARDESKTRAARHSDDSKTPADDTSADDADSERFSTPTSLGAAGAGRSAKPGAKGRAPAARSAAEYKRRPRWRCVVCARRQRNMKKKSECRTYWYCPACMVAVHAQCSHHLRHHQSDASAGDEYEQSPKVIEWATALLGLQDDEWKRQLFDDAHLPYPIEHEV